MHCCRFSSYTFPGTSAFLHLLFHPSLILTGLYKVVHVYLYTVHIIQDAFNGFPYIVCSKGPSRLRLSKPVIAAVSGYAVAGGLELSLLADLRVVEASAIMGVFCRRFGKIQFFAQLIKYI